MSKDCKVELDNGEEAKITSFKVLLPHSHNITNGYIGLPHKDMRAVVQHYLDGAVNEEMNALQLEYNRSASGKKGGEVIIGDGDRECSLTQSDLESIQSNMYMRAQDEATSGIVESHSEYASLHDTEACGSTWEVQGVVHLDDLNALPSHITELHDASKYVVFTKDETIKLVPESEVQP